jgi:PKD repeat protein
VAASCALDSIGSCSVMITGVAAGTFTTTGTYGGDSTHDGSSGTSAAITVVALVPPLTVDFSFSPSSPAVGQSVSFTSSVSGGTAPYTYAWDFGDGSTSAAASPSHTYSAAGSFTVKLTVTDSSSPPMSQSASHDVSVSPVTGQPDFTISANPTSLTMSGESPLCEGSSTLCDDEAGTTITLTSVNGFDGTVRLARSVLTLGGKVTLYCRPSAIQLTPGATVQIRCFAEAEINPDSPVTLTVTITGRFGPTGQPGSLSHSVDITVTVTHAPTPSADSQSNSLLTALSLVTASTVPGDGPRTHRSSSNSF